MSLTIISFSFFPCQWGLFPLTSSASERQINQHSHTLCGSPLATCSRARMISRLCSRLSLIRFSSRIHGGLIGPLVLERGRFAFQNHRLLLRYVLWFNQPTA